jgi:hypothetical protein
VIGERGRERKRGREERGGEERQRERERVRRWENYYFLIELSPLPVEFTLSKQKQHLKISNTAPLEFDNTDRIHKVTFSRNVQDKFGQSLDKDVVWEVKLKPSPFPAHIHTLTPASSGVNYNDIIIYDPNLVAARNLPPSFCVVSKNYRELLVVLYKLNPHTDLKKWFSIKKTDTELKKDGLYLPLSLSNIISYFFLLTLISCVEYLPFGEKVWEKVIQVEEFAYDVELLTNIDLTPALSYPDIGVGQVGVVVMPTKKAQYLLFSIFSPYLLEILLLVIAIPILEQET